MQSLVISFSGGLVSVSSEVGLDHLEATCNLDNSVRKKKKKANIVGKQNEIYGILPCIKHVRKAKERKQRFGARGYFYTFMNLKKVLQSCKRDSVCSELSKIQRSKSRV